MKRCRETETVHDRRSSRHSSSNMKEETTAPGSGDKGNRTKHREDHCSRSKRDRSAERSSTSRSHGYSRSGGQGSSPGRGHDRNRSRKDPDLHERDRRRSRSSSADRYRSNRRSRSREHQVGKDRNNSRKLPERRRSRSRGSSRERYTKHNRSGEKSRRRSRSCSASLSPKRSNHGSSNIVVTGPDSKELTVHIPEPIKKTGNDVSDNAQFTDLNMRVGRLTTPQMALQQAMAAMNAKAQQLTGVSLPKYYNPAAVNPLKYAEQMQKRKLLWNKKEKVETCPSASNNNWEETAFAQDQDGKVAAKFKRLMGIKNEETPNPLSSQSNSGGHLKKQEELFKSLDQQYEQARVSTHTYRGVGLGYSSTMNSISGVPQFNIFPK